MQKILMLRDEEVAPLVENQPSTQDLMNAIRGVTKRANDIQNRLSRIEQILKDGKA